MPTICAVAAPTLASFVQLNARRPPWPVTEQHIRCVINAFHSRAAALRRKLSGDALAESNLSPDEHIEIQLALIRGGFLQNRVARYGANADGHFGPNTRSAIKDFQISIGARPTGFLSSRQQLTLLESPEEREARKAQAAAAAKAQQDAINAKKLEEERAKQEEEKAKQAEKKRLEEEAAKAREWREKIESAQKEGPNYAKANDLNWTVDERTNPMTDEPDYTVWSLQRNRTGALARVEGRCLTDQLIFRATLHDADDPNGNHLGFAQSRAGGIIGNKRINREPAFATSFPLEKWANQIVVSQLSFRQDDPESADTTWRILAEIETSKGTLIINVPTFDPKIQKLITACRHGYEIEKRRQSNIGG